MDIGKALSLAPKDLAHIGKENAIKAIISDVEFREVAIKKIVEIHDPTALSRAPSGSGPSDGQIEDWSVVALSSDVKEDLKKAGVKSWTARTLVDQFGLEETSDLVSIKNEQLDALVDAIKQIQVEKVKRLKKSIEKPLETKDSNVRKLAGKGGISMRRAGAQVKEGEDQEKFKQIQAQIQRGGGCLDLESFQGLIRLLSANVQFEVQQLVLLLLLPQLNKDPAVKKMVKDTPTSLSLLISLLENGKDLKVKELSTKCLWAISNWKDEKLVGGLLEGGGLIAISSLLTVRPTSSPSLQEAAAGTMRSIASHKAHIKTLYDDGDLIHLLVALLTSQKDLRVKKQAVGVSKLAFTIFLLTLGS